MHPLLLLLLNIATGLTEPREYVLADVVDKDDLLLGFGRLVEDEFVAEDSRV